MKIKRRKKDWGSGSGRAIFSSDYFRVTVWKMSNGVKTSITARLLDNKEIDFEVIHEIKSDLSCFEQLSPHEIKKMLQGQLRESFEMGRESKNTEIRECLDIY